jgi:hypothetical protein
MGATPLVGGVITSGIVVLVMGCRRWGPKKIVQPFGAVDPQSERLLL